MEKISSVLERLHERTRDIEARKAKEAEDAARASEMLSEAAVELELNALQLPLALRFEQLNPDNYPLPNSLARGALFAAVKDGKRLMLRNEAIHTLSNYQVRYTGDQLNQSDLDVLMALLTLTRQQPLGDLVTFTAYSILKRMAWTLNSEGYSRLRDSLQRLQRAQVEINYARKGKRPIRYTGSFINSFIEGDERPLGRAADDQVQKSHWMLRIDADLTRLFGNEDVTLGQWYFRKKLDGRAPLAQHLLSYFVTHSEPIPVSVGKLREISGSGEKNESNFIYRLEKALRKLVDIGFLKSYSIDGSPGTKAMSRIVKVIRIDPKVLARLARASRERQHAEETEAATLHFDSTTAPV